MPKRWRMPPEYPASGLKRCSHRLTWRSRLSTSLQHRHVVEHVERGHPRIDAEILGQVAQGAAQGLGVSDHVDIAEPDESRGGGLQGGDDPHQRRLAGPIGTEQAVHAIGNDQIDVVERLHPAGIDVAEGLDDQHDARFFALGVRPEIECTRGSPAASETTFRLTRAGDRFRGRGRASPDGPAPSRVAKFVALMCAFTPTAAIIQAMEARRSGSRP
jgi:hypothetical protein